MKITVEFDISDTLVDAMEAAYISISGSGYSDCHPEACQTEDGKRFKYTVFMEGHDH